MTMKIKIDKTTTHEVEIELPYYVGNDLEVIGLISEDCIISVFNGKTLCNIVKCTSLQDYQKEKILTYSPISKEYFDTQVLTVINRINDNRE